MAEIRALEAGEVGDMAGVPAVEDTAAVAVVPLEVQAAALAVVAVETEGAPASSAAEQVTGPGGWGTPYIWHVLGGHLDFFAFPRGLPFFQSSQR